MCIKVLRAVNYHSVKCRLGYLFNANPVVGSFACARFLNANKLQAGSVNKLDRAMTTCTQLSKRTFQGAKDRFNGVVVNSAIEPCGLDEFPAKLQESLKSWAESGKRGVWFKVALEHAEWVPVLVKNGFDYHHAKNGFVTLYKWLPKDENHNIPPYSHTMVGVGAVVVNDKSEILVVREKYWLQPHWKLPGGYVEPGENIIDAAIREVYEETHIHTEFCSLLNLRHGHKGMFGCSDIYIVVSLKPLSTDIEICEREISECCWMDINEYLNHPNIHELNRFFVQSYLEYKNDNVKIECRHGIHQLLKKPYTVYFVTKEGNDQ